MSATPTPFTSSSTRTSTGSGSETSSGGTGTSTSAGSASPSGPPPSPPPASSPSPSPTCNSVVNCGGYSPPATLYLYTFITTLVILLVVSAGILVRGYVLRRQRALAIANGTWVPPPPRAGGPRRRRTPAVLGPPPRMHDIFLGGEKEALAADEEYWGGIQPLCVSAIAIPTTPAAPEKPPDPDDHPAPPLPARMRAALHTARLYSPFYRVPDPPTPVLPLHTHAMPAPAPAPVPYTDPERVRVAVLVAMPLDPAACSTHEGDDDGDSEDEEERAPPYLEVGVLEAAVASPHAQHDGAGAHESAGEPHAGEGTAAARAPLDP